jgi:hypothetical protein
LATISCKAQSRSDKPVLPIASARKKARGCSAVDCVLKDRSVASEGTLTFRRRAGCPCFTALPQPRNCAMPHGVMTGMSRTEHAQRLVQRRQSCPRSRPARRPRIPCCAHLSVSFP